MQRKFVFIGDETLTIECMRLTEQSGHVIQLVVTRSARVREWATQHGIAHRTERIGSVPECDYILSVANLAVLPSSLLNQAQKAAINFHDGPLPAFAGLNAPVWALLGGAETYGVTWHLMTEEPDAGEILEQETFAIDPEETSLSLNTRCFEAGLRSFERLIGRLGQGDLQSTPQDYSQRTYFELGHALPGGGVIDPGDSFLNAERLVRALDFGNYPNPVGSAWIATASGAVRVGAIRRQGTDSPQRPGAVISATAGEVALALSDAVAVFSELSDASGQPLLAESCLTVLGSDVGENISVTPEWLETTEALTASAARGERAASSALGRGQFELPFLRPVEASASVPVALATSIAGEPAELVAELGTFLTELVSSDARLFVASQQRVGGCGQHGQIFDAYVPTVFQKSGSGASALSRAERALAAGPVSADLQARRLPGHQLVGDRVGISFAPATDLGSFDLLLCVEPAAGGACWRFRTSRFTPDAVAALDESFAAFRANRAKPASTRLVSVRQARSLAEWNNTGVDFDRRSTIVAVFEAAVDSAPEKTALAGGGETLTYAELDERANRVAHHLIGLGAGPDSLVAVHMDRSLDLVVALLGILKSGAAYVPVDPAYPAPRKVLMVKDSGARWVISDQPFAFDGDDAVTLLTIDVAASHPNGGRAPLRASAENLAYVIYTSGSTGLPKGVMLEHRNVVNFLHGMDDRVGKDPGVWLAVTSVSFDISVLELLWTLTRGFEVVVNGAKPRATSALPSLSVFFFGSDPGSPESSYDLLFDAAKFADEHQFEAVWTPERHFHAFGGAFPNPSVTSAALAATTRRVAIRAGSCVLPLHSPIRVAEEWALVDRISDGRVGVSFAAGWHPNDFVLNPSAHGAGKDRLVRDIALVRALWRGDCVEFPGPDGSPVGVRTLPRPVQADLPAWLTSAGDPETFRLAGGQGMNILTHLLGQSVTELANKVAIYRQAWREAGWPGEGRVTLMLHSYVSESDDDARETVREPMIAYLRSSVGLIRQFAASFPAFKNTSSTDGELLESLPAEELRELLEIAFERYYETSGLFGDAVRAGAMLHLVRSVGVDEVACLVDFGVEHELVMRSLKRISALLHSPAGDRESESIGSLMTRHGVTHFQCTPSMAGMLATDGEFRQAASGLRVMMVGGEAFPGSLAAELSAAVGGRLLNMYGPTETTIWSTTHAVAGADASVSIGTPIANTSIYILGPGLQLLPPGAVGELWIGGEGVARGYLGRGELTAERFAPDPFASDAGGRMYRTGDLAKFECDGTVTFLGRVDQQVKVRGYRIEPGEIEALVRTEPAISDTVVIAREDEPGDQRLVCYYAAPVELETQRLRDLIGQQLPAHMVPTNFVRLDALPLTPNKKIDRKALPAPVSAPATGRPTNFETPHPVALPAGTPSADVQRLVSDSWSEVLKTGDLPRDRSFFDCGGNSLLLLQLHKKLVPHHPSLRLTDLFRHPTIDALASYLGDNGDSTRQSDDASRRALARRAAQGRRPIHA